MSATWAFIAFIIRSNYHQLSSALRQKIVSTFFSITESIEVHIPQIILDNSKSGSKCGLVFQSEKKLKEHKQLVNHLLRKRRAATTSGGAKHMRLDEEI